MVFARSPRPRNGDPSPDVVMNDPPDTLHEATIFAMQGLKELRTSVANYSAEVLKLQAQLAQAQAEAATYKQLAEANQQERDHYIRFSTELVTQMQNARHLFDDCFERAKLSLYEKKAIPAPARDLDAPDTGEEPVPAFLTRDTTR